MAEPLRIGLAGLGTVGSAVVRILRDNAVSLAKRSGRPLQIVAVSARRKRDLDGVRWVSDPVALAKDPEIDLFIELMGGAEGTAREAVTAALEAGKPVVTANKALLAAHGLELATLAEKKRVQLNFEASVAGGIPVVKALREGLVGNRADRIFGILNGTCNYILTRMEKEEMSFADCLKAAQDLGYAEADPTFDIGGFDTAHKLSILTSLAFSTKIDANRVYVEGIQNITLDDIRAADELGYRVKLLGVALRTETGIEQRVHPTMVPKESALAQVDGVTNAVAIDADLVSSLLLVGPGAGGDATASAVVADIVDIARGQKVKPFGKPVKKLAAYRQAAISTHEGGYYIRLSVHDRPGAFAAIARRMAQQRISLASIVQRARPDKGDPDARQPVILITYETSESAVRKALDSILRDGHIDGAPQMIRIEKL